MNTEKNQIETEEESVNKSRRRAIGASIATPVLMTLVSKPVFAFQGLSNMLSGNTSANHNVLNTRVGGMSPGFWKDLNGTADDGFSGDAWAVAGCVYGTPILCVPTTISSSSGSTIVASGLKKREQGKVSNDRRTTCSGTPGWQDYTGGTTLQEALGITRASITEPGQPMSLREFLNTDNGSDDWHFAAGFLNARYYDARASNGQTAYMFTSHQFDLMYTNQTENGRTYSKSFLLSLLNDAHYHKI